MQKEVIKRVTKYCIPGVTLTNKGDHWQIRKIGLTASRVKNDPAFGNTRKHAKQFAQASEWAGKINRALLAGTHITKSTNRLAGIIYNNMPQGYPEPCTVFNSITQKRDTLLGFDFNEQAKWEDITSLTCRCEFIRQHGQWIFHLPVHRASISVKPPPGITHYRIKAMAITIDKDGCMMRSNGKQTTLIPWKSVVIQQACLEVDAELAGEKLCIACLYIQWYQPAQNGTAILPAKIPGVLTITGIHISFDL